MTIFEQGEMGLQFSGFAHEIAEHALRPGLANRLKPFLFLPNEVEESKTLTKIDEDYTGALPHWSDHFDTWVFVHNSTKGLGPGVTKKLLDLDSGNQNVRVRSWGFEELRRVVFELAFPELASLLGPIPSRTTCQPCGMHQSNPKRYEMATC